MSVSTAVGFDPQSMPDFMQKSSLKFSRYKRRIPNLGAFGIFHKVVFGDDEFLSNGLVAFSGLDGHEIIVDSKSAVEELTPILRFWSPELPNIIPITSAAFYVRLVGSGRDVTCLTRDIDLAYALFHDAEFRFNAESRNTFVLSGSKIVGLLMCVEMQAAFWPEA
jgi:hypothetical protein